jgi:hypothetical protein
MKTLGDVKTTARGFELIEFVDIYGAECSLQASSLATEDALWLGCDNDAGLHHVTKERMSPRMHLNKDQVKALVRHLRSWLRTGSFGKEK